MFAVRIVNGEVVEVAGPLHYKDVTKAKLESYDFSGEPEDVEWARDNEDDFGLCSEPYEGDVETATDVL